MPLLFIPLLIWYTVPGSQRDSSQHSMNVKVPQKHHLTFNFDTPENLVQCLTQRSSWINMCNPDAFFLCFVLSPPPKNFSKISIRYLFKSLLNWYKKLSLQGSVIRDVYMSQCSLPSLCHGQFQWLWTS